MITQFCGKTLKNLIFTDFHLYNPKCSENNTFTALERLEVNNLAYCDFLFRSQYMQRNMKRFIRLEKPWFIRQFSHLQIAYFEDLTELNTDMLTEFLSLNPQLQVLRLSGCENVTKKILKSIGEYATNLHTLNICPMVSCYDMNEDVMYLKTLRKLRKLRLAGAYSLELLMNMFFENNIPIETLYIHADYADTAQNIPTLETLKELYISELFFPQSISDDCVYNLLKSQTALEYICIRSSETETTQRIIKTLELGEKISKFCFYLFEMDLEVYNSILNLVKNRIKVEIRSDEIEVPKMVLDENEEWLHARLIVRDLPMQDTPDIFYSNK